MCITSTPDVMRIDIPLNGHIIVIIKIERYDGSLKRSMFTMSVLRERDHRDVTQKLLKGRRDMEMKTGYDLYDLMEKIVALDL